MRKIIMSLILVLGLLIPTIKVNANSEFTPNAKSSILMEAKTGTILYENNKNERLSMASMTKVMTLCVIMDAIKDKKISYDQVLTTSENAKSMGGSQAYLEVGETHTLDELLKCICIASANDAAVTVAEAIAGTESKFVSFMNAKASSLGLTDTLFSDCTGLSNENHYTSAYNMAIMSQYLVNNYPEILKYTSMKEDYIRQDTSNPFWLVNTNKLIGYNNIDGLKTGWTNKAGYCITVTACRNDMRLIAVVMGYENTKLRNKEVVELLNYGYSNYELKCILNKGDIIDTINDVRLNPKTVNLVASEDIYLVVGINENTDNIKLKYVYSKEIENILTNNVGNIELYINNEMVNKYLIVLDNEISKNNFFKFTIEIIKGMILT
ncbi:MAG: serine hydrolase [Anaeroplasmataceae bacterium]